MPHVNSSSMSNRFGLEYNLVKKMNYPKTLPGIILALLFVSCLFLQPVSSSDSYRATPDYWPTNGWQTSSPEAQGLNPSSFEAMEDYLTDTGRINSIQAFLIIRNGYIIYELYSEEYSVDDLINWQHATMGVTSILIGQALRQGSIASIDDFVLDFFSSQTIDNVDDYKEAMTIRHLLTMTSGIDMGSIWPQMSGSDWLQPILDAQMSSNPGEEFYASICCSYLLSAIFNQSMGLSLAEYANSNLFDPLGISDYIWQSGPQGISEGGRNLQLTTRDFAKIAFLHLQNGEWDGEQLIDPDWISESILPHVLVDDGSCFGYHWWVFPQLHSYGAVAGGRLRLYIIPEADMIVLCRATLANTIDYNHIMSTYLLPAAGLSAGTGIPFTVYLGILMAIVIIVVLVAIGVFYLRRRKHT